MLLFKAHLKRLGRSLRAPLCAFTAALFVMTLSGCGFRPLYGDHGTGQTTAERYLANTVIMQIKDRIGQQLRNDLLSRLNPLGSPSQPRYSLNIDIAQSISNLGIRKSSVVTRGNMRVTATYTLKSLYDPASGAGKSNGYQPTILTTGSVISTSSYDVPQAQYAVKAALKDARRRAVREIADDLRTRLAVYFKQNADQL